MSGGKKRDIFFIMLKGTVWSARLKLSDFCWNVRPLHSCIKHQSKSAIHVCHSWWLQLGIHRRGGNPGAIRGKFRVASARALWRVNTIWSESYRCAICIVYCIYACRQFENTCTQVDLSVSTSLIVIHDWAEVYLWKSLCVTQLFELTHVTDSAKFII